MDKFRLPQKGREKDTMNRTVRFSGDNYDRLMGLVERHEGLSFNRLVNDAVQFALDRIEDETNSG